MIRMKRILCLVLCIAVMLPLISCGKAAEENPQVTATETQLPTVDETRLAVTAYLEEARQLMESGNYDSAVELLLVTGSLSEDPAVVALLAEAQAAQAAPLKIDYALQNDSLQQGTVEIHSVTAQKWYTGYVRFTIEYTAPAGMSVSLLGDHLDYLCDFNTVGSRSRFVFEVEEGNFHFLQDRIQVRFAFSPESYSVLDISAVDPQWTADPTPQAVDVPFTTQGKMAKGSVKKISLQVKALTEDILEFGLVHRPETPGDWVVLDYRLDDEAPPVDYGTLSNRYNEHYFYIDRQAVQNAQVLTFQFSYDPYYRGEAGSEKKFQVVVDLTALELPEYIPVAGGPSFAPDYWVDEVRAFPEGTTLEIRDCQVQLLNNNHLRCTVAYATNGDLKYFAKPWYWHYDSDWHHILYGAAPILEEQGSFDVYIPLEKKIKGFEVSLHNDIGNHTLRINAEVSDFPSIAVNVLEPSFQSAAEGKSELESLTLSLAQRAEALTTTPDIEKDAVLAVDTSMIRELQVVRSMNPPKEQSGVAPYAEYRTGDMPRDADISGNAALAYSLTFSDATVFSDHMPAGFDPEALLEWGKNPGLNVDVLHALGYTGKGAVIAYVDHPAGDHAEYDAENIHRSNSTSEMSSMHGPAVLSLLAGRDIGTAPEAEVWFYGQASWEADQTIHAQSLYQIIEQNKLLPEGKKITMVGFSDVIDPNEKNAQTLRDAVKACEEAGIMVWFCDEYGGAMFLPMTDKDNYRNVVAEDWFAGQIPELVMVPAAGRTVADTQRGQYTYYGQGGLSWAMPYVLGIYAIANQIDPGMTQDEMRELIVKTAYVHNGMKIIHPVGFVAAVLEQAGREADAKTLLAAEEANVKYTYAVMNKGEMTGEDISAAYEYLKTISDSTVLVVDSTGLKTAQQLYEVLQADHIRRGGTVTGVQLFGSAELVPAFDVGYSVQAQNGLDADRILTDIFYGNFDNAAQNLSGIRNIMDAFHGNNWSLQIVPRWAVARLPLEKGEFAEFFRKYTAFGKETGFVQPVLTNFSNPIFAAERHVDDMGIFLNRMNREYGMGNLTYRLYGNQLGQYPVAGSVLGDVTVENLTAENAMGVREFVINSHGQKTNLDRSYFEQNKEKRESLMNMSSIDTVLGENSYYLDLWTCSNGEDMGNNLITAALNGKCMGAFAHTHLLFNNGVDNMAGLQSLATGNFYYFYLHYFRAVDQGTSRSEAFALAQQAYGASIIADSVKDPEGVIWQFNLCNLLSYHNFGVLVPGSAFDAITAKLS